MAGVGPVVERVIVGTLSGIEPKNGGWMRFSLQEDGKQYPVKCETKKPETIKQATALLGERVKIKLGEQLTDNINPNNNKPYINRYLNQIAVAGPQEVGSGEPLTSGEAAATQAATGDWGTGQAAQQPSVAAQQQAAYGPSETVRELRIMRIAASKNACDMLAAGEFQDGVGIEDLVAAAESWVAYFVYGAARFGVPAFDAGIAEHQAQQPAAESAPPDSGHDFAPHGDDDIPF